MAVLLCNNMGPNLANMSVLISYTYLAHLEEFARVEFFCTLEL